MNEKLISNLAPRRGTPLHPVGRVLMFLAICLAPCSAFAHQITGTAGGLSAGFLHPLTGLDHMLAMLAVGIWGAQIGGRALWTLPVVFPMIMALGGFAGAAGMPLPYVEVGIALSVIGLGLAITFALKPAEWIGITAVGIFAVFHGHAHGTELPQAANAVAYGIGFVTATGLLHLAGIGVGLLIGKKLDGRVLRACGAAICLAGIYFLSSHFFLAA